MRSTSASLHQFVEVKSEHNERHRAPILQKDSSHAYLAILPAKSVTLTWMITYHTVLATIISE